MDNEISKKERIEMRRNRMDITNRENQLWGLHQQAISASWGLVGFINTMLSNSAVLTQLCRRDVFFGLNVSDAIQPIQQQIHQLQTALKNIDSWHTDNLDRNYQYVRDSLNSIKRMRRDVRVLAHTVGIPTKRLTAEELLNYAHRNQ